MNAIRRHLFIGVLEIAALVVLLAVVICVVLIVAPMSAKFVAELPFMF